MIDWVSHMLEAWGHWAARTESRGIGYRRFDSSCREAVSGKSFDSTAPSDTSHSEYERLTAIIDALPMEPGRQLKALVVHRYRDRRSYRQIAGTLLVPQQTLRDRMHEAHTIIARALTDFEVREKMPSIATLG